MQFDDVHKLTAIIKEMAADAGFSECRISPGDKLTEDRERLEQWLEAGFEGTMEWMGNHIPLREDPSLLVPGARSVISVLMNYYPEKELPTDDNYMISKYAYGADYHDVIRKKLKKIIKDIAQFTGPFSARAFTDSAPVFDRARAERSGLGWIGKNTCLINPKIGSFFFIGEIICDLELAYDEDRVRDLCGGCHKCLDACPTGALVEDHVLDSRKCISYLTIENRGELPEELKEKFRDYIFGCDICQDVCPWNRIAKPHTEASFEPPEALRNMNKAAWESLTEETFHALFSKSAVRRTKFTGLKRNILFLKNK